jgi:hypothetical protein
MEEEEELLNANVICPAECYRWGKVALLYNWFQIGIIH